MRRTVRYRVHTAKLDVVAQRAIDSALRCLGHLKYSTFYFRHLAPLNIVGIYRYWLFQYSNYFTHLEFLYMLGILVNHQGSYRSSIPDRRQIQAAAHCMHLHSCEELLPRLHAT